MKVKKWLVASCLLGAGWMALAPADLSHAEDVQVASDGWRPKWQPVPIDSAAELATAGPSAPSTPATQLNAVATAEEEPFDWHDDLYADPGGGGVAVVATASTAGSANRAVEVPPSQPVKRRWCQCQQSAPRLCGHCGLPRPVQAAYREAQPAREGPRTMLAGDEPTVPAVDRLRLALEQLNDRVQQTLGQF